MYSEGCYFTYIMELCSEIRNIDRSMEFGGPGLTSLSMDERATLCNMATECSAKTESVNLIQ